MLSEVPRPLLANKYLALDFGGTHVCCAAVQGNKVLASETVDVVPGTLMADVLRQISPTLHAFCYAHGGGFRGVGMGFCGLVDHAAARISSTNRKYDDAAEIDLTLWAQRAFNLPFRIENDSRLALLGEHFAGAARGSSDVVLLTLGTGLGTAAISEGRLLRGKHSQAGILGGHLKMPGSPALCSCGGTGCYEAQGSTFALPALCLAWPEFATSELRFVEAFDFYHVFAAADAGDRVAHQIRAHCLEVWKACAISLVHAYDADRLVLGGGVLNSCFPILPAIRNALCEQAWTPWGKVDTVAMKYGRNAALLGVTPLFEQP